MLVSGSGVKVPVRMGVAVGDHVAPSSVDSGVVGLLVVGIDEAGLAVGAGVGCMVGEFNGDSDWNEVGNDEVGAEVDGDAVVGDEVGRVVG